MNEIRCQTVACARADSGSEWCRKRSGMCNSVKYGLHHRKAPPVLTAECWRVFTCSRPAHLDRPCYLKPLNNWLNAACDLAHIFLQSGFFSIPSLLLFIFFAVLRYPRRWYCTKWHWLGRIFPQQCGVWIWKGIPGIIHGALHSFMSAESFHCAEPPRCVVSGELSEI